MHGASLIPFIRRPNRLKEDRPCTQSKKGCQTELTRFSGHSKILSDTFSMVRISIGGRMSFSISLKDEVLRKFDGRVLCGEIEIDGYTESFFAPVDFWSKADYLESWKKSLAQGLRNRQHAVLMTSMHDPDICNFISYWVIYLEGKQAYIQNAVLFLEELHAPFVPDNINSYISKREEINEDGVEISQWKVDVSSVLDFYKKISK